jgi:sugar phosphate isomerase/epimerase
MNTIKIGTLVGGKDSADLIRKLKPYGFETYAINFWQNIGDTDLAELAKQVKEALADQNAEISCIGVYGNALMDTSEGLTTKESFEKILKAAPLFGAKIVTGFAGGVLGKSVPDSLPKFKEVYGEFARMAEANGLKIALENCPMGGSWKSVGQNIAFNPDAWELIFNEIPSDSLGLQWEPAHQMMQLIDPMAQLAKWTPKIFNVHGKDAIDEVLLHTHGICGKETYAWNRTPGFGDSNWTDIISYLRLRLHRQH